MSKPVKDMMTNEYTNRFTDVDNACVVSVVGLDGVSSNQLRGELKERNIHLQVVKNSLIYSQSNGHKLLNSLVAQWTSFDDHLHKRIQSEGKLVLGEGAASVPLFILAAAGAAVVTWELRRS